MSVLRVIGDDEARTLVNRAEVTDLVIAAYHAAAQGKADVSRPSAMMMRGLSGSGTEFKVKGAVLDALNVAGFRMRPYGARATAGSHLYVMEAESGRPLGLVSEAWLARVRTASTALVTCRALLPVGAKRLALIGTGRITEEFIRACDQLLPHVEIVLASRSTERARAAAEQWRHLTPFPLSAAPVRDALAGADVVVTLSDAAEILFKASDVEPHALVCALGGRYEFDRDVFDRSAAFVVDEMDFVCAAGSASYWISSGQLTRKDLEQRLDATIGEILLGTKTVAKGKPTLAIIQGMAICDLAIAKTVLDRANRQEGAGAPMASAPIVPAAV